VPSHIFSILNFLAQRFTGHRIGQTKPVAVYRLLTFGSVDIDMMEKALSKKKLERMTIAAGGFKKPGRRANMQMSFNTLVELLSDDIKDLQSKGQDESNTMISDEEFELIMNREKLFAEGKDAIPTEGKMYDIIEAAAGDLLGAMET
jgi:ATP-dependent DNA helicase